MTYDDVRAIMIDQFGAPMHDSDRGIAWAPTDDTMIAVDSHCGIVSILFEQFVPPHNNFTFHVEGTGTVCHGHDPVEEIEVPLTPLATAIARIKIVLDGDAT